MASQLTRAEVLRIAELARLHVSEDEAAMFARQLTAILEYAASVQRVDTSQIAASTASAGARLDALREDVVAGCLDHAQSVALAPDSAPDRTLFRVPKVL